MGPRQKKPDRMTDFNPETGSVDETLATALQTALDAGQGFKGAKKKWARGMALGFVSEAETKNADFPEKVVNASESRTQLCRSRLVPDAAFAARIQIQRRFRRH